MSTEIIRIYFNQSRYINILPENAHMSTLKLALRSGSALHIHLHASHHTLWKGIKYIFCYKLTFWCNKHTLMQFSNFYSSCELFSASVQAILFKNVNSFKATPGLLGVISACHHCVTLSGFSFSILPPLKTCLT